MLPNVTIAQSVGVERADVHAAARRDRHDRARFSVGPLRVRRTGDAPRRAHRRRAVATTASAIDTQRLIDAIDERTALVAMSHVLFRSAYILDVDGDLPRARAKSARASRSTRFIPSA